MRTYFDVHVQMGRAFIPVPGAAATARDLIQEMDRAGIARAVVWHPAQTGIYPGAGNELISRMIAGEPRLEAAWTLMAPATREVVTPAFFDEMKAAGVRVLRAFPSDHRYRFRRSAMGRFLDEVAERRIPVLMSPELGLPFEAIDDILTEYPTLTAVVCDVGIWGADRKVWPLLENYPRLYVETSLVSLEAGGLEAGVRRFGAWRFLYGSKFPHRYFEAPMLDLEQADLPSDDKDAIAANNLESLLKEVML